LLRRSVLLRIVMRPQDVNHAGKYLLGIACRVAASSNKSLHWIFTPLRSVKTSEFKR